MKKYEGIMKDMKKYEEIWKNYSPICGPWDLEKFRGVGIPGSRERLGFFPSPLDIFVLRKSISRLWRYQGVGGGSQNISLGGGRREQIHETCPFDPRGQSEIREPIAVPRNDTPVENFPTGRSVGIFRENYPGKWTEKNSELSPPIKEDKHI